MKFLKTLVIGATMVATLHGNAVVNDIQDFREGHANNRCIQTAEYVDGKWVEFTKRQLQAGAVYDLSVYNTLKMDFGGIKFKYNETVDYGKNSGKVDVYGGRLDNGDSVKVSSIVKNRSILLVEIEGQHPKKMVCIKPDSNE